MLNYALINDFNYEAETEYQRWARVEKVAYCENESAIISEKKLGRAINTLLSVFSAILG